MEFIFGNSLTPGQWALFAIIGVLTGIINTLAGSGSLVTLPIFILICGLSPTVANGTNRIGAFLQSFVGAIAFWREKPETFKGSIWVFVPSIIAGVFGAIVATKSSDNAMKVAVAILMVAMLVILLSNPTRWIRESTQDLSRMRGWKSIMAFAAIGFYGGFIQAGVGIFLLAGLVLVVHYNLKDANAIKLAITAAICVPSLVVFGRENQIHYAYGIAMAVFQTLGAFIGVWLAKTVPNISIWMYRLLVVMVAVSAFEILRNLYWSQ